MKRITSLLGISTLVLLLAVLSTTQVNAGRSGGSVSAIGVVPAYQTITYEVSFDAGSPAVIVVSGSTTSPLNLLVSDANGNYWIGKGMGAHKMVRFGVIQTGNFQVVIQNLGPVDNMFTIRTN